MNKKTLRAISLGAAALMCASACLCGCKKEEEPTSPAVPETTAYQPTLDEMCPPTYKKELPVKIETDFSKLGTDSFSEISAESAMISGLAADKILKDSAGREYYILTDGTYVMSFVENGEAYSAFYREGGHLQYFGDSETGWYFNEDGSINMVSFTYINSAGSEVISYYEPDGTRIAISAGGAYYDNDFEEMSVEQQLKMAQRIGKSEEETEKSTD